MERIFIKRMNYCASHLCGTMIKTTQDIHFCLQLSAALLAYSFIDDGSLFFMASFMRERNSLIIAARSSLFASFCAVK